MGKIRVWTKQHIGVWENLQKNHRHTAKKEFIHQSEEAMLTIDTYDWLVNELVKISPPPVDADYPVWVSMQKDATMLISPNTVILELLIPEEIITYLNIPKWTAINNYSYIPEDEDDLKRHKELLKAYRTCDTKAFMSNFYPEIKNEILNSWSRIFDDNVKIGNDNAYGLIWEIKSEWVISCTI